MEIMFKSIPKYTFIALGFLSLFTCKEPCLDLPLINAKTEEIQSWYTNSEITTKPAESSVGITDDVILVHDFQDFGDAIWDDCGNVTQAERSKVRYDFFNFPFSIETIFNKQGEENGFDLRVNYNMYSASYYFTAQNSTTENTITSISDYELNDIVYPDAFKVTFNQTENDTEINELILVKEFGVIYILLNNGISLEMD